MKDFVILTDSTCDLDKELRKQYNIDYAPMNYIIDDVEYVASLDWTSHSSKEYYNLMRDGKRSFTTQVPQNVYYDKFKAAIDDGKDVLYISCSSALSGSINIAVTVAKELNKEYPDAKIYCIDSLISSLGQGHLAITAAKMRNDGASIEEVAEHIKAIRLNINQFGTVATMEYLKRAGRVKASKAFFGNLFGIKPIIISDIVGQNYAYKKVKGTVAARKDMAQSIVDAADGNYENLYISHADCLDDAISLKDEILALAPFKNVIVGVIGPIVGASVGPGTVIAFCYGKEVTIEGKE